MRVYRAVPPCDSVHVRSKFEVEYQRKAWLKWFAEDPKATGKSHGRPQFFDGVVLMDVYFVYDCERWIEDCAQEMRYWFQRHRNLNR